MIFKLARISLFLATLIITVISVLVCVGGIVPGLRPPSINRILRSNVTAKAAGKINVT